MPVNMKGSKPFYRRRWIIILVITPIVVTLTSIALHIWFKANARKVLKRYITEKSNGKLRLELSGLDLNLFLNRVQIREADLISTDSTDEAITYHVKFRKLTLRVESVWALLFKKQLLLDSIKLHDPMIDVMQWRKDTTQSRQKDELSLPQEMGKVYHSMQDALDEFGIERIIINNAQIRLINKMKPGAEPVMVSQIFFDLARPDPKNKTADQIKKEQTIELKTTNQDIALPGGRHRLAFKSFKLQLLRQRIEFDSCTVTAIATDTSKSNYRIFFKKLFLSGVDLNALSTQNVIKADSVYCENPYFHFDLYKSITSKKRTEMPDVQKMIGELSGNLDLAFVGIINAGIHFDIHGKSTRSFYNSNKDNFEMTGFRIAPDSTEPVAIKRFEMTLRDYHLYNGDSSSAIDFDSLRLLNNKIALNNFSLSSRSGHNKIRNEINIKVPYFQLTDLDWYQMIFDQKMVAQEAAMISPVINFKSKTIANSNKKLNLYTVLDNIDSLVELNKITITNGKVDIQLKAGISFNVQNMDLGIQSNKLLGSTNKAGLRSAVEHLSFSNGILRLKNLTAYLQNTSLTGDNQVYSDKMIVSSKNNSIAGTINNVHINNLFFDSETIELDGLHWESALLDVRSLPGDKKNKNNIHFKNISGKNSKLTFSNGPITISTSIEKLAIASLVKNEKNALQMDGFYISGKDLLVKNKSLILSSDTYSMGANQPTYLHGMQVQQFRGKDSLHIRSPEIKFSADLNALLANDIHLDNLIATAPVIKLTKWDAVTNDTSAKRMPILIDKFTATEPEIYIATHRDDSVTVINIPASPNSIINATGILLSPDGTRMESLMLNTSSAMYTKASGEKMSIEKGNIELDISNIYHGKKDGINKWHGMINKFYLQDTTGLKIGNKSSLRFKQASFGNLNLSSEYMPGGISKLLKASISAWLRIPEGEYRDSNTTFKWYNAAYDNNNRTLHLDSLQYHPTSPLDSVLAHSPYQLDYTTLSTGPVTITGLNAEQYEKDSSFIADTVMITNPVMTFYRDKLPPDRPNKKDKPLPVNIIKNITVPVAVKNVFIKDGEIAYTEKNAKSRQEGTLLLTGLNGRLQDIKNRSISVNDSMSLLLKGYLMDSAALDISIKQSYTDSLSGFLVNLTIKSTPLTILNPLIVPLSNVKLISGILDSLTMNAVGRNDMAMGEMKMHYHDLKIKLVKDGDPDKTTFLKNVISFLANTFLIKDKNRSRTGVVYFDRLSTHSFPKYLLKMTVSGAATSIGAKKNRKIMRAYKAELKRSGMPAVK